MVHELDIIYNQVPGKVSTLNSSELMADNVRAAARGSSSALKTAEGNFDVDHHSGAEWLSHSEPGWLLAVYVGPAPVRAFLARG